MEYPKFKVCCKCFTFNHAKFITDAMNGFTMQQTSFPFVCTIVDDASTDGEQEVIKQYVEDNFDFSEGSAAFNKETDYAFITYAQHKTNKNCYFAVLYLKENHYSQNKDKSPYLKEWRDGVEYMAICEGDDYWIDSMKIQIQVDYMDNHPDCGMTRTDVNVLYDKNGILKHNVFENGDFPNCKNTFIDYIVYGYWSATCTWMIRRNLDIYYPLPPDCFNGDLAIMIKVIKVSDVKYISQSTAVYRVLEESASHINNKEKAFSFWRSQVNTRCYFAKTIPLKFKFMLIKSWFPVVRGYYIVNKSAIPLNIMSFCSFFIDVCKRIF